MLKAGTGYSKHRNAKEAARTAAQAALQKAGRLRAETAVVFASTRYRRHYHEILAEIQKVTGAKNLAGASGSGILTEETEIERQSGIAVMVIDGDELQTASFLVPNLQENNLLAGEKTARILREASFPAKLLLLLADPFSFISPLFFDGFEHTHGYLPIIGGAAAEEGRESKTYQFEGGRSAFDAAAGLVFGGRFRFETGLTRSCRPFGEPLRVTRSDGQAIYEMDGRPAYDILLESISHIGFEEPRDILKNIFLGLPTRNFQTDFSDNHYLVRHIMGMNAKKGSLTCTSPVEEGEYITFTYRNPSLAKQDLKLMLEDLRERLSPSQPALGFYFNCCARGEELYGNPGEDAALIREYFPGVPVIGFFGFGEIAPLDHVNHMHHHSGVLTFLTED